MAPYCCGLQHYGATNLRPEGGTNPLGGGCIMKGIWSKNMWRYLLWWPHVNKGAAESYTSNLFIIKLFKWGSLGLFFSFSLQGHLKGGQVGYWHCHGPGRTAPFAFLSLPLRHVLSALRWSRAGLTALPPWVGHSCPQIQAAHLSSINSLPPRNERRAETSTLLDCHHLCGSNESLSFFSHCVYLLSCLYS